MPVALIVLVALGALLCVCVGVAVSAWMGGDDGVGVLVPVRVQVDVETVNGYPVSRIGPARFPDCRRPTCFNTAPHTPGRSCIS